MTGLPGFRELMNNPFVRRAAFALLTILLVIALGQYISPRWFQSTRGVELHISTDKEVYYPGEIPKLQMTLVNGSAQGMTVALPADGSLTIRYPRIRINVTPPLDSAPLVQVLHCGYRNPFSVKTFSYALPGSSKNLYGGQGTWLHIPTNMGCRGEGVYTVQATYDTKSLNAAQWIGGRTSMLGMLTQLVKAVPIVNRVPRMSLTSETIEFRYESKYDNIEDALRGEPAEAAAVLHRLTQPDVTDEKLTAFVDGLIQHMTLDPYDSGIGYYQRAAPKILAEVARHEDAMRLWEALLLCYEADRPPEMFDSFELTPWLVRILMHLDPPAREGILRQLLVDRDSPAFVRPFVSNVEVLCESDDPDITRLLVELYEETSEEWGAKSMLANELKRRGVLNES